MRILQSRLSPSKNSVPTIPASYEQVGRQCAEPVSGRRPKFPVLFLLFCVSYVLFYFYFVVVFLTKKSFEIASCMIPTFLVANSGYLGTCSNREFSLKILQARSKGFLFLHPDYHQIHQYNMLLLFRPGQV